MIMEMEELQQQLFGKLPYSQLTGINVNARWGAVAVVPLLLVVLAYFLLVQGTMAETDKVREEMLKTQKDVQVKEALERRLPEFEKKIAELDGQLALIRRQLPEKREIPNLLDDISNMGTQSGLEFQLFKPLPEDEKDFYAEVPVDLTVRGQFHSVVEFFDKLSRMPRIVTISNFSITKGAPKSKGRVKLPGQVIETKCKAVTFRFLEAKVDGPGQVKK